jgi:excisionase family DNA binding protein
VSTHPDHRAPAPHPVNRRTDQGHAMATPQPVPTVVPDRHLYRIPEAMLLLSMSRSVIYEQIRAGRLRTVTQGRSRLVPKVAIDEYVNLLIRESKGADFDQAS